MTCLLRQVSCIRFLLLVALVPTACSSSRRVVASEEPIPASAVVPAELAGAIRNLETDESTDRADLPLSVENIHAALWTATAVEFRALTTQTYRLAHIRLDEALADTSWSAALEQEGAGRLPPAIVLDVDETVLDNTTYQARLIASGAAYSGETWDAWVAEAAAIAIPGAVAFTRYAASRGVRVVYLTNRDASGEDATRRNLAAAGFPLTDDPDDVLTRGERPEWRASDKGPRRAHVASRHRILLLVGDNLGDFLSDDRAGLETRERLFAAHDAWWGTRWIMLPNPQYGSWESATFDHDFGLSAPERMSRKLTIIRKRADG